MTGTSRPERLVSPDAELEQLATGFGFTEGPAWSDAGGFLVFSDIPGNVMRRWTPGQGVADYRRPSQKANGNAYDHEGRLVSCEHATSKLVREEGDELAVLADRYDGRELNSPNDVVVAADGSIYFTDPTYGRSESFGRERDVQLDFRGVYRLTPAGDLEVLDDTFTQPNGLCFSPDGRTLFVNDSQLRHIRSFRVGDDGSLRGGEVIAQPAGDEPGVPDGMKVDAEGNIWCTGPGGIHILDPGGTLLGIVAVPEVAANLTWGGPDRDQLFICASTSLYRIPTRVAGHCPI
jgi:gluconolactonase